MAKPKIYLKMILPLMAILAFSQAKYFVSNLLSDIRVKKAVESYEGNITADRWSLYTNASSNLSKLDEKEKSIFISSISAICYEQSFTNYMASAELLKTAGKMAEMKELCDEGIEYLLFEKNDFEQANSLAEVMMSSNAPSLDNYQKRERLKSLNEQWEQLKAERDPEVLKVLDEKESLEGQLKTSYLSEYLLSKPKEEREDIFNRLVVGFKKDYKKIADEINRIDDPSRNKTYEGKAMFVKNEIRNSPLVKILKSLDHRGRFVAALPDSIFNAYLNRMLRTDELTDRELMNVAQYHGRKLSELNRVWISQKLLEGRYQISQNPVSMGEIASIFHQKTIEMPYRPLIINPSLTGYLGPKGLLPQGGSSDFETSANPR